MKIIIIGSIAAGVSAAARLAAAQRGAQITVYEKGGFYSCGTGGLPHYLCEDLDSLNKAIQAKETELNAQGITAHLRHEVRGIDAAARKVTVCDLATGRVFEDHYDKLVLATGSSNRVPQVPGSDRVGVQTLKTVEDLIFLKEFVRTPYVRDIVILGGSWAGLEIAKSFLKLGRNVRIIEKEQQLLPQFDPDFSGCVHCTSARAAMRGSIIYSACSVVAIYSVHKLACAPRICLACSSVSAAVGSRLYTFSTGTYPPMPRGSSLLSAVWRYSP